MLSVLVDRRPPLLWVTLNRPAARNAVDGPTAAALAQAFRDFEADPDLRVAILSTACMRGDRRSAYEQWEMSERDAIANEFVHGLATAESGETSAGVSRFGAGTSRHGKFDD